MLEVTCLRTVDPNIQNILRDRAIKIFNEVNTIVLRNAPVSASFRERFKDAAPDVVWDHEPSFGVNVHWIEAGFVDGESMEDIPSSYSVWVEYSALELLGEIEIARVIDECNINGFIRHHGDKYEYTSPCTYRKKFENTMLSGHRYPKSNSREDMVDYWSQIRDMLNMKYSIPSYAEEFVLHAVAYQRGDIVKVSGSKDYYGKVIAMTGPEEKYPTGKIWGVWSEESIEDAEEKFIEFFKHVTQADINLLGPEFFNSGYFAIGYGFFRVGDGGDNVNLIREHVSTFEPEFKLHADDDDNEIEQEIVRLANSVQNNVLRSADDRETYADYRDKGFMVSRYTSEADIKYFYVELDEPAAPDSEEYPAWLEMNVMFDNNISTGHYVGRIMEDDDQEYEVYVSPEFRDEHDLVDTMDRSALANSLEALRDYWELLDSMSKRVKSFEPEFKLASPNPYIATKIPVRSLEDVSLQLTIDGAASSHRLGVDVDLWKESDKRRVYLFKFEGSNVLSPVPNGKGMPFIDELNSKAVPGVLSYPICLDRDRDHAIIPCEKDYMEGFVMRKRAPIPDYAPEFKLHATGDVIEGWFTIPSKDKTTTDPVLNKLLDDAGIKERSVSYYGQSEDGSLIAYLFRSKGHWLLHELRRDDAQVFIDMANEYYDGKFIVKPFCIDYEWKPLDNCDDDGRTGNIFEGITIEEINRISEYAPEFKLSAGEPTDEQNLEHAIDLLDDVLKSVEESHPQDRKAYFDEIRYIRDEVHIATIFIADRDIRKQAESMVDNIDELDYSFRSLDTLIHDFEYARDTTLVIREMIDRKVETIPSYAPEFILHSQDSSVSATPKHRNIQRILHADDSYKPNEKFEVGDIITFLASVRSQDTKRGPYRDVYVAKVVHKDNYTGMDGKHHMDFWAVCSHNPDPYRVAQHKYPRVHTSWLIEQVNSEYKRISQSDDFKDIHELIDSNKIINHSMNDELCFFSNPIDGIDEWQLKDIRVLEKGFPTFAKEFVLHAKGMPGPFDIPAECHDDHHAHEVEFDAVKWFEQATPGKIDALRNVDWGYDYPADDVGLFMSKHVSALADMFTYIESNAGTRQSCGFECQIDGDAAEKWLKNNPPKFPSYAKEFVLHSPSANAFQASTIDKSMSDEIKDFVLHAEDDYVSTDMTVAEILSRISSIIIKKGSLPPYNITRGLPNSEDKNPNDYWSFIYGLVYDNEMDGFDEQVISVLLNSVDELRAEGHLIDYIDVFVEHVAGECDTGCAGHYSGEVDIHCHRVKLGTIVVNDMRIPSYAPEFRLSAADEFDVEHDATDILRSAVNKLCNTWECDDWDEKELYEWEVRTNLGAIFANLPRMPKAVIKPVTYAINEARESAYDQYMSEFGESLSTMHYGPKNYQELVFALNDIPKVFPEMTIPDADEFDSEYFEPQFESMFLYINMKLVPRLNPQPGKPQTATIESNISITTLHYDKVVWGTIYWFAFNNIEEFNTEFNEFLEVTLDEINGRAPARIMEFEPEFKLHAPDTINKKALLRHEVDKDILDTVMDVWHMLDMDEYMHANYRMRDCHDNLLRFEVARLPTGDWFYPTAFCSAYSGDTHYTSIVKNMEYAVLGEDDIDDVRKDFNIIQIGLKPDDIATAKNRDDLLDYWRYIKKHAKDNTIKGFEPEFKLASGTSEHTEKLLKYGAFIVEEYLQEIQHRWDADDYEVDEDYPEDWEDGLPSIYGVARKRINRTFGQGEPMPAEVREGIDTEDPYEIEWVISVDIVDDFSISGSVWVNVGLKTPAFYKSFNFPFRVGVLSVDDFDRELKKRLDPLVNEVNGVTVRSYAPEFKLASSDLRNHRVGDRVKVVNPGYGSNRESREYHEALWMFMENGVIGTVTRVFRDGNINVDFGGSSYHIARARVVIACDLPEFVPEFVLTAPIESSDIDLSVEDGAKRFILHSPHCGGGRGRSSQLASHHPFYSGGGL